MTNKSRVSYFYHPSCPLYYYGPSHPMKPHRLKLAHHLILTYGLYKEMDCYHPHPASAGEMTQFHSEDYVQFLSKVTPDNMRQFNTSMTKFNAGETTDCPVFDGLFEFTKLYTGASLDGAIMLCQGQTDVAVNWSGGLHHAKKGEASGFCYINDIVLAILELLKVHARVLYIDIDIHHGDGVEEAFYCCDRVMTFSLHKYGDFFPGTGHIADTGAKEGLGFSVNAPLNNGMADDVYVEQLFKPVLDKIMQVFQPGAIVLQCGADSLTGDRLGCFNLTLKGHAACVKYVKSFGVPMLVLGGGGYTIRNVARCWAYETAVLLDRDDIPNEIPFNDYYEFFAPDYELHLTPEVMDNLNTPSSIDAIRTELLQQLSDLQGAPSVAMHEVPPLFQRAERDGDDDNHNNSGSGTGGGAKSSVDRRAHSSELTRSLVVQGSHHVNSSCPIRPKSNVPMIWWAFCCGDESSVQSSSSNSPGAATAAAASASAAVAATETTPLLARNSPHTSAAVTPTPKDGEEEGGALPSSLSGSHEDEENVGRRWPGENKSTRTTDESADALAWKEARATLLRGCAPDNTMNAFFEKTNESAIDDLLSLPVTLDSLPTPTSMKHVAQLSTWDCGIACLEMVFDWLGVATGVDRQAILKSIPTRSVWSADLVRLLDQHLHGDMPVLDFDPSEVYTTVPNAGHPKGRYMFCSQTLTVNDELNSFAYYQTTFEGDRVRVEAAFQWLKDHRGESLIQRPCLPLREIVKLLIRPDCVVMILVDNAILSGLRRANEIEHTVQGDASHDDMPEGAGPDDVTQPTVTKTSSAIIYMGHYILLTGVVAPPKAVPRESDSDDTDDDDENDDEPFMFQAHNPSLDFGPVLLSPQLLDDARIAPGTDHDVLFIIKLSSGQDG